MKPSKFAVLALLTIGVNANSHAIFGSLVQDAMTDSYSKFHGEGLPKRVGKAAAAIEYRKDFMDRFGIYSSIDELGIQQFSNNNIGLALIKTGNDDEAAFNTVLAKKDYRSLIDWKNGKEFIEVLEDYTSRNGCIPKITSVSHGWVSSGRRGEGVGLSGKKGANGIYATERNIPSGPFKWGSRSLEKDLAEKIRSGAVQFCGSCVAQFYACNVGAQFASEFSKVTGCQTVVATGQNSPWFQSSATQADRSRVARGAHYWKSEAGDWSERQSAAEEKGYGALGSWYRSTPVKDSRGTVRQIISENLGKQYISL